MKQRLIYSNVPTYSLVNLQHHAMCFFNLQVQLELILYSHLKKLKEYRTILKEGNGDISCSSENLNSFDPLVLYLHFSTDGGQFYTYKKRNVWPVHGMLLDLPLKIRSRSENMLLMALWDGSTKPDWSSFLDRYLHGSCLNKEIVVCVGYNTEINVVLKLHTAVFDLPAMASVLNHIQFNGEFGCVYCCSPGVSLRIGRGHSRKYGGVEDMISDEQYAKYCKLASETNQSIFGIKGKSCIAEYIQLPSHVLLDSLHLLFENCSKSLILKLINSTSYREKYFVGRYVDSFQNVFDQILLPNIVSKPRTLNDISFWKGRDYMYFLFYFSIPSLYKSLFFKSIDKEYAFHFLVF